MTNVGWIRKCILEYINNPNINVSDWIDQALNDQILMLIFDEIEDKYEILKLFFEYGANVNMRDGSLLVNASINGNYDIVKLLFDFTVGSNDFKMKCKHYIDFDIDFDTETYVYNPNIDTDYTIIDFSLICSARNGYFNIVQTLVENGANVHVLNDQALRESVKFGHYDIANFLVKNSVNTQK